MQPTVLWIDDKPKDYVIFRGCLLNRVHNLDVANSFWEADQRLSCRTYDAIFMRPELTLSGRPYSEGKKRHNRIPFAREVYEAVRTGTLNSKSLLYLLVNCDWVSDETTKLCQDLESEGFILSNGGYAISNNDDPLTKIIYTPGVRPSQFAYDIHEQILRKEISTYQKERNASRVDG